jgi:hypothetical protein
MKCHLCNSNIEISFDRNGNILIRQDCLCENVISKLIKCEIYPCILIRKNYINDNNLYHCVAFERNYCVWNNK